MIFNMVGGGGTGGASIFIVNSVNQRPTNVFSNTLWVNTDVDVVKYVFSDNEPSNPTEGMLWLTISNSDNVNVVAPINKDWMKFNLGIVKQYIDGVWERKVAQLYKDGIWVDVSRMFSATISITYPANSTCVITNSGGQTVASDTNTGSSTKTFTATVNATGTYTVTATATDGSGKSKSQSVSITADGQSVSVSLTYEFVLFDGGIVNNITWDALKKPSQAISNVSSVIEVGGTTYDDGVSLIYPTGWRGTTDAINLSGYNSLKVTILATSGNGAVNLGVGSTATTNNVLSGAISSVADSTAAFDISTLNNSYFISIYGGPSTYNTFTAKISKVWLE